MMLITIDTVTPMITLNRSSQRISGTSITLLSSILDSQDSTAETPNVPNISARETRMKRSRILRSLSFFCFCFGVIA